MYANATLGHVRTCCKAAEDDTTEHFAETNKKVINANNVIFYLYSMCVIQH